MAYWLSKILPLALLPLGLSLVLLLVGLVARWRWPVISAVVLLWLFSLGLVSKILWRWLEHPLQRESAAKVPSADAIVVLSGGRAHRFSKALMDLGCALMLTMFCLRVCGKTA